jgi:ribosomal protein L24
MRIKIKDNILINSGPYKGNKGKVINIIKTKKRALVEIFTKEGNRLIEIDLSNLLLRYRPINDNFLNTKKFQLLKNKLIKMRKRNKKLTSLFSREELNNLLKIRDLETIKNKE